MTASLCLCTVGADRCVCPLLAVVFSGTHKGCPHGICSLLSVLCYLLGGHTGTAPMAPTRDAPTASVLCYLFSVLFRAGTAPTVLYSFGHPQGMPLRHLYSVICSLYSFGPVPPLQVRHTAFIQQKETTEKSAVSFMFLSIKCLALDLLDTSLLTCEGTQVVKFSTTNTTTLVDSDAVDCR